MPCRIASSLNSVLGMLLIVSAAAAPVAAHAGQAQDVRAITAQEVQTLVARLALPDLPRDEAWRITARLQKLGPTAVTALVSQLRQDSSRRPAHEGESAVQRALEKIGTPAIAELDRVLTPSVLSSTDSSNVALVQQVITVAGRIVIDAEGAAALLVRVARESPAPRVRGAALDLLNSDWLFTEDITGMFDRPWLETCAGRHWSACPFDALSPRLAAAVRPLLAGIDELVRRESDARVRFAGARLLAKWGTGEIRRAGEEHLMAIVAKPGPSFYTAQDDSYARDQAIETLGMLGVVRARDVIAAQTVASSDDLRLTVARALARLQDPRHVPILIGLMSSQQKGLPYWAMQFAGRSRNTAFVPALIERVNDKSWNGIVTSSTMVDGKFVDTPIPIGPDALAALHALTFQDFGDDAAWRAWWASSRDVDWHAQLVRFVESTLPQMETAKPWVMNGWMNRLAHATDPAVLPLVTEYLRNPRVSPGSVDAHSSGSWAGSHPFVELLMGLVGQGSSAARQLLYECADTTSPQISILAMECTRAVASFDPRRAADRLAILLGDSSRRVQAAELLVQLGDVRGIPALIDELDQSGDGALTKWRAPRALGFLRIYTQQDIPYDPAVSNDARHAAANAWRAWWQDAQSTFALRMKEARIDMPCSNLLSVRSGCS